MGTEMDELYVGNFRLVKEEQDPKLRESYYQKFDLDWAIVKCRVRPAHRSTTWCVGRTLHKKPP